MEVSANHFSLWKESIIKFLAVYYGIFVAVRKITLGDMIFHLILSSLCVATTTIYVKENTSTLNKAVAAFSWVATSIGWIRLIIELTAR